MTKVLVLGSTGNIGKPLLRMLASDPCFSVVAGVHHDSAMDSAQEGVQKLHFDFLDSSTFNPALKGVNKVFFVRPPQLANPERDMLPFLEAAKAHDVDQVVFVSLLGVEKNPMVPHRKIEAMIKDLRLPYTFLRPSFFMQNLTGQHGRDLRERHDLFVPAGKSRTSFIDCEDIAAVAMEVMKDPKYVGKALSLTGPEALTYDQVATIMTRVTGVPITYSRPGLLAFRKTMLGRGVEKEFANVMVMLYVMTRLGTAKVVTNTVERVLGRPARSMEDFAHDEVAPFLASQL